MTMMLLAPLRAGASPAVQRQPRPATSQLRHMSPRLPCSCHRNRRLRLHSAGLPACCAQAGSDGANEDGAGKHEPQPTVRAASAGGSRSLWARGPRVGMPQDGDGSKGEHDGKFVIDRDGNRIEVMFHDYGFRSGHGRLYMEGYGKIPVSGFKLAMENFQHEYTSLRRSFRFDEWREFENNAPSDQPVTKAWRSFAAGVVVQFAKIDCWLVGRGLLPEISASKTDLQLTGRDSQDPRSTELRDKLAAMELSNREVTARERRREAAGLGVESPWYETFGWWRAGADLRKVHFAEEWNELHHLQIMESLGGDELWVDRFIAQHAAIVYYWILLALFWFDPDTAYNFSELIEAHAVDTYGQFADQNEELLKGMPPPLVALQYYKGEDLYMFDEFQTSKRVEPRRPSCRNLHDVFINIRDDEGEHVKTMRACQTGDIYEDLMEHTHST